MEKKEGYYQKDGNRYTVTDLPGSYSLSANSDEEIITRDYIAGGKADVVCILADASQLERSFFMLADYTGIDIPAILLLNLMDIAQGQGKGIDVAVIEQRLGIPVTPFVAAERKNYEPFYKAIDELLQGAVSGKAESKALSLAQHFTDDSVQKKSSEYSLIVSVARYYSTDAMTKVFLAKHETCNMVYPARGRPAFYRCEENTRLAGEAVHPHCNVGSR